MAILDGKSLKGSIGNLTFSKQGKNNVVKSKPGKGNVKQTAATKQSANVFGAYISPLAKFIRMSFSDLSAAFYDGAMVNRMNSDISNVLFNCRASENAFAFHQESFNRLIGFNFNLNSVLNKSFLIQQEVKFSPKEVQISIPEFLASKAIRFPTKADTCKIELLVVQFNLEKGCWFVYPVESTLLKKGEKNEAKKIQYPFPAGTLCLVGVRTLFTGAFKFFLNDKTFNPASIISASFNPGSCLEKEVETWYTMSVKMKLEASNDS